MTELNRERLQEILHYDPLTGIFTWSMSPNNRIHIGTLAGTWTRKGYLHIGLDNRIYRAHRLAWLYTHGRFPLGVIDHINGNPRDNRLVNLREVRHAENMQNQHRPRRGSNSGIIGVFQEGKRWRARIGIAGKQYGLGTYDTPEQAREAYINGKRKLHPGCVI